MKKVAFLLALSLTALSSAPASSRGACSAPLETDYYSDASHTTKVGMCTITCAKWDLDPGAVTCTGTMTAYNVTTFRLCPCPP